MNYFLHVRLFSLLVSLLTSSILLLFPSGHLTLIIGISFRDGRVPDVVLDVVLDSFDLCHFGRGVSHPVIRPVVDGDAAIFEARFEAVFRRSNLAETGHCALGVAFEVGPCLLSTLSHVLEIQIQAIVVGPEVAADQVAVARAKKRNLFEIKILPFPETHESGVFFHGIIRLAVGDKKR